MGIITYCVMLVNATFSKPNKQVKRPIYPQNIQQTAVNRIIDILQFTDIEKDTTQESDTSSRNISEKKSKSEQLSI